MENKIKLTESELKSLVENTVQKVVKHLNEDWSSMKDWKEKYDHELIRAIEAGKFDSELEQMSKNPDKYNKTGVSEFSTDIWVAAQHRMNVLGKFKK